MSASTAFGSVPSTAIGKLASTGTAKSCTFGGIGSSGAPRKKKKEKQPTRKSIAPSTCHREGMPQAKGRACVHAVPSMWCAG